jgi:hypothetical protein
MTFDELQLARRCFHFANLAYEEVHDEDRATSTQVVYGGSVDDLDEIYVGLRGTKELRDFLTDARFTFKAKWIGSDIIRLHRGVHKAIQAVLPRVLARVRDHKKIYVVGHSLGGMKALPLALMLRGAGLPVAGVQTFGCPRVGNGYFRNYYNALLGNLTLRWEAQGDPFPYSPPLFCNYRHAGRAAYLKNDGRVIFEPTLVDHVPAYLETLARTPQMLPSGFLGLFDPHDRTNYRRLFAQLKEAA